MKKIDSVKQFLDEMITDLEDAGQNAWANDLKQLLLLLDDENETLRALEEINGLCHVRILGDAHMPNFEGYEWLNKVGKLSQKSRRALRVNTENT